MENENGEEDERSNTCVWMLLLLEGCMTNFINNVQIEPYRRLPPFLSLYICPIRRRFRFLPSDYRSIISRSLTPIPDFHSNKDLYVYLCHHPVLIDEGRKSFSLEKRTGKKCYFLSTRDLNIVWSDAPEYWNSTSLPESRFPEVAQLKIVWWLEIWGTIKAGILSPLTSYTAYFVYKIKDGYGFYHRPTEVSVGISGVESGNVRFALLHPDDDDDYENYASALASDTEHEEPEPVDDYEDDDYEPNEVSPPTPTSNVEYEVRWLYNWRDDPGIVQADKLLPKLRDDGWFEIELGEFFIENEDDCIEMRVQEVKVGLPKHGLIVEGIEIR
uniref:F-box protein PP2-B12 n=1 Tax=Nicotiana tabacum TaxID=4097 RepID=A0A1S4D164_TOBAC|nr:PREDICTED: putative F-box protein PP2-B12 [Nicotiana tabacum]